MGLSEKHIVTEKCQCWQNLGLSEKLREKFRCIKCNPRVSTLKQLQLALTRVACSWQSVWRVESLRTFFYMDKRQSQGKSRSRWCLIFYWPSFGPRWGKERQVGGTLGQCFHDAHKWRCQLTQANEKFFSIWAVRTASWIKLPLQMTSYVDMYSDVRSKMVFVYFFQTFCCCCYH